MKKLKTMMASALMVTTVVSGAMTVSAKGSTDVVVDEAWGNASFVYGSALTKEQKQKTKDLLGIKNETLDEVSISGKDKVHYLGYGNPNSKMYSSAVIEPGEEGKGVVVQIVTPENITEVTTSQYSNALITAGASDVNVKVASPIAVSGHSALTGVYKAFDDKDVELDKDRMKVAQKELDTVTDITKANEKNDDFNADKLDKAIIDIKKDLAEKTDNGDKSLEQAVAEGIVNSALKANGLDAFITPEQTSKLVQFALDYSKTGAVSSAIANENLNVLTDEVKDNLVAKTKELGDKGKSMIEDESLWEKVTQFFSSAISGITGLFGK